MLRLREIETEKSDKFLRKNKLLGEKGENQEKPRKESERRL